MAQPCSAKSVSDRMEAKTNLRLILKSPLLCGNCAVTVTVTALPAFSKRVTGSRGGFVPLATGSCGTEATLANAQNYSPGDKNTRPMSLTGIGLIFPIDNAVDRDLGRSW